MYWSTVYRVALNIIVSNQAILLMAYKRVKVLLDKKHDRSHSKKYDFSFYSSGIRREWRWGLNLNVKRRYFLFISLYFTKSLGLESSFRNVDTPGAATWIKCHFYDGRVAVSRIFTAESRTPGVAYSKHEYRF